MIQDENEFLKELQEACLKEVEDYLNDFREILSVFKDDPNSAIEQLQKVIHSMKGNLQAVAFLQFGNFVHELETLLDKKSKEINPGSGKVLPDFEVLVFEYLLSSILEGMGSYLQELKVLYLDSDELAAARQELLNGLDSWQPKFETSEIPIFTSNNQTNDHQPDIDSLLSGSNPVPQPPVSQISTTVAELELPDTGGFQMEEQKVDIAQVAEVTPVSPAELELPQVPELEITPEVVAALAEAAPAPALSLVETPTESAAPPASAPAAPPSSAASGNSDSSARGKRPPEWADYRGSGLFLLFQNHKKYFAIAIEHIVEVIKSQPLSSPPHKRKNLRGLLNLRGEVLPILNVEEIVTEGAPQATYVVVSQVDDMRFGFQVESVHQVVTLDPGHFQTVEGLSGDSGSGIVTHFCQTEDKTISILKLNELVAA